MLTNLSVVVGLVFSQPNFDRFIQVLRKHFYKNGFRRNCVWISLTLSKKYEESRSCLIGSNWIEPPSFPPKKKHITSFGYCINNNGQWRCIFSFLFFSMKKFRYMQVVYIVFGVCGLCSHVSNHVLQLLYMVCCLHKLHQKFTFFFLVCEELFHRSKHVSICYSNFVCHVPTERNITLVLNYISVAITSSFGNESSSSWLLSQ